MAALALATMLTLGTCRWRSMRNWQAVTAGGNQVTLWGPSSLPPLPRAGGNGKGDCERWPALAGAEDTQATAQ